jgi:cytochrome bd ubiquinol oxidase subunit II
VSAADACAAILWAGVMIYALTGGADFGAGFWDLVAGNAERGRRPRALLDRAIGPVWEANHVWLIFVLVVMWTAFPPAYSAILSTLFIPFTLAALGIVLRGASFAFRKASVRLGVKRAYGAAFALSSVLTPFFLGAALGGVASERVPPGNAAGDLVTSWANPASATVGALAVAVCAYLAAVYLIAEARRAGDPDLERYFRRRAVASGLATGALALAGVLVLRDQAEYVYDRLVHEALPLVILSAVCGVAVLALVAAGRPRGTRVLAAAAVAAVIWGWAVAQWPYALPRTLTVSEAAGVATSLRWVVVVFGNALVLVVPLLVLLYVLDQRSRLEEEGEAGPG